MTETTASATETTTANTPSLPVFEIGLAMSGAISAGAYTAGVLDYLLRAMSAHNARAEAGGPDAPKHKVAIRTITGASAGGICAGLGVASLINQQRNGGHNRLDQLTEFKGGRNNDYTYMCALSDLHDAWVTNIRLWADGQGLLGTVDIDSEVPLLGSKPTSVRSDYNLASLLDSTFLDVVARKAMGDVRWGSADSKGQPFDFISTKLDVFLTTTNLSGLTYSLEFDDNNKYSMSKHAVPRHFRVMGLGTYDTSSAWLTRWNSVGIPLDLTTLEPGKPIPFVEEPFTPWKHLTVAALATGAFPVGLAPRQIQSPAIQLGKPDQRGEIEGGALAIDLPQTSPLPRPAFPEEVTAETPTPYVAVDGGALNNDPFDIADYVMRTGENEDHPANQTIIMISPFPTHGEFEIMSQTALANQATLLPSISAFFSSLLAQARFKINELARVANPSISRFLISPIRNPGEGKPVAKGAHAIACGSLGGFGGFMDITYRSHDFVLGQRNCQLFLMKYFKFEPDHQFCVDNNLSDKGGQAVPIIEPGASVSAEVPLAPWPTMGATQFTPLFAQLAVRVDKVIDKLRDELKLNWFSSAQGFFVSVGVALGGRSTIKKFAVSAILANAAERNQLTGFDADAAMKAAAAKWTDTPDWKVSSFISAILSALSTDQSEVDVLLFKALKSRGIRFSDIPEDQRDHLISVFEAYLAGLVEAKLVTKDTTRFPNVIVDNAVSSLPRTALFNPVTRYGWNFSV